MAVKPFPALYVAPEEFIKNWSKFSKGLPVELPVAEELPSLAQSALEASVVCREFISLTDNPRGNEHPDDAEWREVLLRDFDAHANGRYYDANRVDDYLATINALLNRNMGPKLINKVLFDDFYDPTEKATYVVEEVVPVQLPALSRMFHTLSSLTRERPVQGAAIRGPVPAVSGVSIRIRPTSGLNRDGTLNPGVWQRGVDTEGILMRTTTPGVFEIGLGLPLWKMFYFAWVLSKFPKKEGASFGPLGMLSLAHIVPILVGRRITSDWGAWLRGNVMDKLVKPGRALGFSLF